MTKQRFLQLQKIWRDPDREATERAVRTAIRKGCNADVVWIACQHPLRPIQVRKRSIREELVRLGFISLPFTDGLMLVPEGTSRRAAKWIVDRILQAITRRNRTRRRLARSSEREAARNRADFRHSFNSDNRFSSHSGSTHFESFAAPSEPRVVFRPKREPQR